ncbi:LOW QUALITY PROTEIN: nitric oxide synthase-interacting protein [Tachypleus tridentatus]|uniref:LOW QUALITY PROTEIN: nitric oxide synthase-interacting protein n=1 Tax=Tachypleus tridentatus TaxID=6853 RepID=UPI003FD3787A
MTRHAKNCTAGAVYTYHERQKDTKAGCYGTQQSRIGKDSVKDFDCCCLTLQPCRNPVLTPDGYLFDKEAILEYIIHQKKEIARKLKEYEKQKKKEKEEQLELTEAERRSNEEKFLKSEKNIISKPSNPFKESEAGSSKMSVSNMSERENAKLPSFWIPSLTPSFQKNKLQKPDTTVYCPMSGKPLKAKDLIPVKFTLIDPSDNKALVAKNERYKCAVTHDVLGNSVPVALLRTSGNVVTMDCVEKLIKVDMIDPTNEKKLTDEDIIPFQRGGTGYASTNVKLEAAVKKPVLTA